MSERAMDLIAHLRTLIRQDNQDWFSNRRLEARYGDVVHGRLMEVTTYKYGLLLVLKNGELVCWRMPLDVAETVAAELLFAHEGELIAA